MTLESGPGVSLVPVAVDHAPLLAALVQRNIGHLGAYLPAVTQLASADAAKAYLEAAGGDILEWHVFADGALCGAIRVKDIDRADRKAKIGYFIGSEFAGRGIASRAMRAVLAHCFGALQLNRIELRCAAANLRSMRMAERLGFTREGVLRQDECLNGVFVDSLVYGLLRSEFIG